MNQDKSTKREELSFLTVCAFPNDSKIGFVHKIFFSNWPICTSLDVTQVKYWMTFFVFSVFPAPDSPLHLCYLFYLCREQSQRVRDKDGLVLMALAHVSQSSIGNGVYVRRTCLPRLSPEPLDDGWRVDGKRFVWVHGYQKET